MAQLVALVLGVVLLAGCGSALLHESHWRGDGVFVQDRHVCLHESMQVGSFMDAVGRQKLFQSCMEARNWREVGNEGW